MPSSRSSATIQSRISQVTTAHQSNLKWLRSVRQGFQSAEMISKATEKYDEHMKRLNTELAAAQESERSAPSSAAQTPSRRPESFGRTLAEVANDEQTVAETHATLLVAYNQQRRDFVRRRLSTTNIDEQWTHVQRKIGAQRRALAKERDTISEQSTQAAQQMLDTPTLRQYRH